MLRAFSQNNAMHRYLFLVIYFRYFNTMRRRNYVTPTSYLELIKTFKNLLNKKRLELLTLKDRYSVGLEKLEFSESQVGLSWYPVPCGT